MVYGRQASAEARYHAALKLGKLYVLSQRYDEALRARRQGMKPQPELEKRLGQRSEDSP